MENEDPIRDGIQWWELNAWKQNGSWPFAKTDPNYREGSIEININKPRHAESKHLVYLRNVGNNRDQITVIRITGFAQQ